MTLRRWYFVAAIALVAALTPALAQAASPRARRLVAGSSPPMSHGRWLMGRGPVAPFTAEVVYRTPEAPTRLQTDSATPTPHAGVRNYLILVMKYLYWHPDVEVALATYINDVENEGLTVELIQLDGGTHWGLRDLLISKHAESGGVLLHRLLARVLVLRGGRRALPVRALLHGLGRRVD